MHHIARPSRMSRSPRSGLIKPQALKRIGSDHWCFISGFTSQVFGHDLSRKFCSKSYIGHSNPYNEIEGLKSSCRIQVPHSAPLAFPECRPADEGAECRLCTPAVVLNSTNEVPEAQARNPELQHVWWAFGVHGLGFRV